ncbi:MAG TPA: phosphomannomutase/phosphoglucomutase [Novosphingobium sp.]|nr:phosphomannomutase/phosphoglucomutase [Novosphingobium sp.]
MGGAEQAPGPVAGHRIDPAILREYDIRGRYGHDLAEADAFAIGAGFARVLREAVAADGAALRPGVAVGRDGRLSSPALEGALVAGLVAGGVDVWRIGIGPTPMLYYAEASMPQVQGGIQVTGSHNPPDHNGFKIVLGGRPFFGADLVRLGALAVVEQDRIAQRQVIGAVGGGGGSIHPAQPGAIREVDLGAAYVDRLLSALDGVGLPGTEAGDRLAKLRIAWDAGNGAAGPIVAALAARLPGEHTLLFCEVNGHFPNHHPDPSDERNLADILRAVVSNRLDFGLAFDGDGDRLGVIDGQGRVLWGDELLVPFAQDVLRDHSGATILADVKTSQVVFDAIAAMGGQPQMWKSGHSLIKSRMKETGALLGGEMTGHVFFADRWYGFDDALYAALRLIAAVARGGRSVTQWRDAIPRLQTTPELRFAVDPARKRAVVAEVAERLAAQGVAADTTDGLRVNEDDGWWLLRASNTQDMLTARAESATPEGLERLLARIDAQLAASGIVRAGAVPPAAG